MNKNLDCEVLVIGSGAGGSTIAETLTDQGFEVLMVEEGPKALPLLNRDHSFRYHHYSTMPPLSTL